MLIDFMGGLTRSSQADKTMLGLFKKKPTAGSRHVKRGLSFVALILLFTACNRRASKSQNPLVGTWVRKDGCMTLEADGTFHSRWTNFAAKPMKDWSYEGTWEVDGGFLVLRVTKAVWHNADQPSVGGVERHRILRQDKDVLVIDFGDQTNSFERRK